MALRNVMTMFAGRLGGPGRAPSAVGVGKALRQDRRVRERYVSVLRLGKLSEAIEMNSYSSATSPPPACTPSSSPHRRPGERLTVDLGNEDPLSGKIVWTDDNIAGVAFDDKIDIRRALARVAPPGKRRARAPRVKVDMSISARPVPRPGSCLLIDISQGGGKIRTDAPLKVGDELTLEIRGFGKVTGTIRWVRDGVVAPPSRSSCPIASWPAG